MPTPAEVYALVRNQCGEDSTEFWNEDEIYYLMSIAERLIAQQIGLIETSTALTTVTSTKSYDVSSVNGIISRVEWDSYSLKGITQNDIDQYEGKAYGGVVQEGNPAYYYVYGSSMFLSPTPSAAKTLEVFYRSNPVAVTTASTSFSIADEYTDDISDYVLYRMFLKDQELIKEAAVYKTQWNENIDRIRNNYSQKKNLNVETIVNMLDSIEVIE